MAHKDFEAALVAALTHASMYFNEAITRLGDTPESSEQYGSLIMEEFQGTPVISFAPIYKSDRYTYKEGTIAVLRSFPDTTTQVEDMRRIITSALATYIQ
jgi:hypothetical protein